MKKESRQNEMLTMEDCFSLEGKSALIMGGAGKMAESFSRTLLHAGCERLVLTDIDPGRLAKAVAKLSSEFPGRRIRGRRCDAADERQIKGLASDLKKKAQPLDIFIYAVLSKPGDYYASLADYKPSVWDKALKGNLSGAFLATQALLPLLRPAARIVFIGSVYAIVSPDLRIYKKVKSNLYGGKHPLTLPAVYPAAKSGLIGLGRYLAVYLADRDIRVNILIPGGVFDFQDESFYREYIKRVPLGRMAVWSDYNGAILFLASEASRYMTGQVLVVDGGLSAW